jgi:site-specific recombinase XerD
VADQSVLAVQIERQRYLVPAELAEGERCPCRCGGIVDVQVRRSGVEGVLRVGLALYVGVSASLTPTSDKVILSTVRNEEKIGALTLLPTTEQALEMAEIAADARDYVVASRAENTTRVYRTGWAQFTVWCDEHGVTPLPASAETVAFYMADLAKTAKPATIDARLAAISSAHRAAGYDSPTKAEAVRLIRRGVRRTLGTAQRRVRPVTVPELRTMVEGLGTDPAGCRDRALLLLGFAGALRRSELVGLDVADFTEGTDGFTVRLRRSKTDQEGAGRTVGIPYGTNSATCPVRAWRAWLEVSGITEGPAFRSVDRHGHLGATGLSAQVVALVLKRHAAQAGLDPKEVAGHSLRAGLATSAAAAGVPERVIADQTGHKGTAMLRKYIREGSLFRENAASAVGL